MLFSILYLLFGAAGQPGMNFANPVPPNGNEIKIELRLKPSQLKDSGTVYTGPVETENILYPRISSVVRKPVGGVLLITMQAEGASFVDFTSVLSVKRRGNYLAEPGDSILVTSIGDEFLFSGRGAAKYRMQCQLDSLDRNFTKPNNKTGLSAFSIDSLGEYFQFERYYQNKLGLALALIDRYKGTVSDYAITRIKNTYIRRVHAGLHEKWSGLKAYVASRKMPAETIARIYDSTHSGLVLQWARLSSDKQVMEFALKPDQLLRAYGFDPSKMPDEREMQVQEYEDALKVYKGERREKLIVDRLPSLMIKAGFTPKMEQLIAAYYAEPGFPETKSWMKKQEFKARRTLLPHKTPGFVLPDNKGKLISKEDLVGKIIILNFQGSDPVTNSNPEIISKTIAQFRNHPEVVFINISTKKNNDTWQKSLAGKKNAARNVINVSTGGQGTAHHMIRDYAIDTYPWIWVMSGEGKILNVSPLKDFTKDNGESLVKYLQQLIIDNAAARQKKISIKKDGPYVFHDGNNSTAYWIDSTALKTRPVDRKARELPVQTDLDKKFTVGLQSSLAIQPSTYPAVDKMMVFSDIEGNFDALRKLLQMNRIIDENFNWIYGKGNLVFAGDMFDRGNQVTECLWLMYDLEEKAKAAGGYVHFILGNHDIMNMQGNNRYVTQKYRDNAAVIGKSLPELYNEHSEIGRWLRTKNVIEKIGDLLFLHGGISPEVNRLPLTVEEMNATVRPYYGKRIDTTKTDKTVMTLYDSEYGEKYRISPFWSRGYYKSKKSGLVTSEQLDSTLRKFEVRRIVTGHTVVADTISVHYGGRVINTDTKHTKGKSEALLIEGDRYYRVNDRGDKILLFIDEKKGKR